MIGLLQRVSSASVSVDGATVAEIGAGLLVLVGVEREDGPAEATRLAERLLACRVFADDSGRMNLSLADTAGELLLVPQFTLAADTQRGNRPGFESAAPPERGLALFELLLAEAGKRHPGRVGQGRFGATMQVRLCNEGPVTFWLQVHPRKS